MILKLKHKTLDISKTPFFIAEIGFNFCNDIKLAKEMICAAKESGADAVKFQSFMAETLLLEKNTDIYRIIEENELSKENHILLKKYCDEKKIDFFSTPFNIEVLNFLDKKLKVKIIKIASGDMDYKDLLVASAQTDKPIILSTGLSDKKEIDYAVKLVNKYNKKLILMHCIGNYPLESENANLLTIPFLIKKYRCPVGFSDHSIGTHIPAAAAALGAKVFEKHFTINRKIKGADNSMSTEPQEFSRMVNDINDIVKSLGEPRLQVFESEKIIRTAARRSVYAAVEIKKGTVITRDMIKVVRPRSEKNTAMDINKILSKKSKKNYSFNQAIEI